MSDELDLRALYEGIDEHRRAHRERRKGSVVPRTASAGALVVLFAVWAAAIVGYFDAFLNAVTDPPVVALHNRLAALAMGRPSGAAPMPLAFSTLPLVTLLILTRLRLPIPDRDTLGMLGGALIVMLDVAILGDRYRAFRGSAVAPLLGAVISMGALRIVITAALRRWNVRSRL